MTTTQAIRTSAVADRRELRFGRIADIVNDADRLDEAARGGEPVRASGNWSPGQIVDHVAVVIEMSLDGFPRPAPVLLRIMGRLMKSMALNRPMKPGFKIPARFREMQPGDDVTWEAGVDRLRRVATRIEAGERMTQPSPVLGPLSHEEWEQLHCRHAAMHFSFLHGG